MVAFDGHGDGLRRFSCGPARDWRGAPLWVLPRGQSRSGPRPPCGTFSCAVSRLSRVLLYRASCNIAYIRNNQACVVFIVKTKTTNRFCGDWKMRTRDRLKLEKEFDSMSAAIYNVALSQWRKSPAARNNVYRIQTAQEYAQEVQTVAFAEFIRMADSGISCPALATSIAYFACKRVNSGRAFGESGRGKDVLDFAVNFDDDELDNPLDGFASRGYEPKLREKVSRQKKSDSTIDPPISRKIGGTWRDYLTACGKENPADLAALLIDLADFFKMLTPRMRQFAIALASGQSAKRIAAQFNVAHMYVFQIRARLDRIAREHEL